MRQPFWYPPILTIHRVSPVPCSDTPSLSPQTFERQMTLLTKHRQVVSLGQLIERLETDRPIPRRWVVVTFDDGTEDTYPHAFPILAKYRIPAAIFLIASEIGRPGYLNPDQIHEMQRQGITFGSHTLNHDYLPGMPLTLVEESLSSSRALIRSITGSQVEFLSYPAGGFTEQILRVVQSFGYRAGLTTNRGFRRFPIDRWALRRISLHAGAASPVGTWFLCSGYHGLNRWLRAPS